MKIYYSLLTTLAFSLVPSSTLVTAKDATVPDATPQQQMSTFHNPARQAEEVEEVEEVEEDIADEEDASNNRYIVKFKAGSDEFENRMREAGRQYSNRNLRRRATATVDEEFLTYGRFLPKDNAEVMYLSSDEEVRAWRQKDGVEYVEQDSKAYLHAEEIPYGITKVHALDVPDTNVSNRKVCIVDSGYDISHPDLSSDPDVVTGYTGPFSAGPWNYDGHGHGTHVAGTIAAIGGNDEGVVGVNRNGQVKLHIVRVFGDRGTWAWTSTLIGAVQECVDSGSNIVSMSLGSQRFTQTERDAYQRFYTEDNVLLVASAGNGRGGLTSYSYPASYEHVMSVAAIDSDNNVAVFSQRNSQVNIAAPGVSVLSTLPREVAESGYGSWSGTSMACPHVSGVAALIWSLDTSKSARQIRDILQTSAQDLGASGRDNVYGHGLVRADSARGLILDPSYTPAPTPTPTLKFNGYCNYRGCNGEIQGGEWCNEERARCEGECEGTWCRWNPAPMPTNSPILPTSHPTKTPTPPTDSPTKTPTISPSHTPTVPPTLATSAPTPSPSVQPTPCQDVATDEFFLRMKSNADSDEPVYKSCEWLVSTRNEDQKARICSKTDSHNGYGPAREVCKDACGTCNLTPEPSTVPTKPPTVSPTSSPTKAPTNAPTRFPTSSTPCCSQDFRTCPASLPAWCDQSAGNCQQCGGTLIVGAPLQCIGKWGECTNNVNGCCSPATCQGNRYYRQCLE